MNNEEELSEELQEFTEASILIYIPENTVELKIISKIYANGQTYEIL